MTPRGEPKRTTRWSSVSDMAPRCGTSSPQVNPDASHLLAPPAEIGTASAAARGFVGLAPPADTVARPPERNDAGPPDCSDSSSTECHDRIGSTPSSVARTTRTPKVVRRSWVRCLPHRAANQVRVGLQGPILVTGLVPCGGSGLWFVTTIGARCRLLFSSGLSPSRPTSVLAHHTLPTSIDSIPDPD